MIRLPSCAIVPRGHCVLLLILTLSWSPAVAKDGAKKKSKLLPPVETSEEGQEGEEGESKWDIEKPRGPQRIQRLDVTEGTWMNLDLSPDGRWIAFDLLGDIYVMPIGGAHTKKQRPRKLTEGVAWDMQPRFSPDGKHIAFTSDRRGKSGHSGDNIWIADFAGKSFQQVTDETYRLLNGPAWSPDGEFIVARKHFSSRRSLGAGEMWMYHRHALASNATGGLALTKRPNDQKDVNEPIFSPDGKFLYYSQDATAGDTFEYDKDSNKQIYVVKRLKLATGETDTYISGPGGACRPTPSPDGKTIAFVRRMGAKTTLQLFDTASGRVRLLYDDLERDMQEAWAIHGVYPTFAWTPDGRSIVIWARGKIRRVSVSDGKAKVVPFHIRDTRRVAEPVRFPVKVAPKQFDVRMLRWVQTSPNGEQVAYQALGYIYVKDLPNGKSRRLTKQTDHFEFYPSYSRDGRHIVYTTWNDQQLGSVRVASVAAADDERWKVTKEPGHYIRPVFSPNGKMVVFERKGGGRLRSPLWSHETGLYSAPARGGEMKRIAKSGSHPQFANDSQRVFFLANDWQKDADNLQLRSIQLDGQKELTHYTSQWATDYRVSPKGDWVAFIERFHVYLTPFIQTGKAVSVGPQTRGVPVFKLSDEAGDSIHFSGNGKQIHWSLGPELFSTDVDIATRKLRGALIADSDKPVKPGKKNKKDGEDEAGATKPTKQAIGFRQAHARPKGAVALVGGRLVTMNGKEIVSDGTVLIHDNRITAVGSRSEVKVPKGAIVIPLEGRTVMPGFIDTHAHGSQATHGITPQRNWVDFARLAFGVTTIHDPSNDTPSIFAASELTKAGRTTAPRTFSTGTILYGATGSSTAEVNSLEDAEFHLRRMKAVGAFSVKSYNQPRRDQRQQVLEAARKLKMMVVPEGGSLFMHNMTMIVDGHTGIEHTLPVQSVYDDVMDLWRGTMVGYTPTLSVAYGGISGEQYWYETEDLWLHPRLQSFIPPHILNPRARRRDKSPEEDYNHIRVAEIAKQVVDNGGLVQAGGHGQLNGICTHWEMWSFVQGGMTPWEALRCGTLYGAKYLGLDQDLGSLEAGKLADVLVFQKGADPTQDIRDSERIEYVIANGQVFDAQRMNRLGSNSPRPPFFWEHAGHGGISTSMPRAQGCGCARGGSAP